MGTDWLTDGPLTNGLWANEHVVLVLVCAGGTPLLENSQDQTTRNSGHRGVQATSMAAQSVSAGILALSMQTTYPLWRV